MALFSHLFAWKIAHEVEAQHAFRGCDLRLRHSCFRLPWSESRAQWIAQLWKCLMGLGKAILSFTVLEPEKIPMPKYPRWAVLGRSNVGTVFLNALIHPHSMFRTGAKPGVTRGLVAANVQLGASERSTLELVDLPGFGFAKGARVERVQWTLLAEKLREKSHERGLLWLWLADPTRKPDDSEMAVAEWLGTEPYSFVFTKADQVKAKDRPAAEKIWAPCLRVATEGPYWTSAMKGEGMDAIQKSARNFVRLHS